MTEMNDEIKSCRLELLNWVGMEILKDSPEAAAVVFFELDCGCTKVSGASDSGDPVGKKFLVAGVPSTSDKFICSICIKDKGSTNRFIGHGIMWRDKKGKKPDEKHRNAIYQKAFGCDAPEIEA